MQGRGVADFSPHSFIPTEMPRSSRGMTAMPGLVDMHVHLGGGWANETLPGERYAVTRDDESVQQNLSGHLYAGVTPVLDMGNDHAWVICMRDRINGGELVGPRVFAVGGIWTQTPSGWPEPPPIPGAVTVISIEAISGQMDRYTEDGIEIIKFYTGISPQAMQFVVDEANKRRFFACHRDEVAVFMPTAALPSLFQAPTVLSVAHYPEGLVLKLKLRSFNI